MHTHPHTPKTLKLTHTLSDTRTQHTHTLKPTLLQFILYMP
uniref:Uncharacterized protein n=1 Tax=Anguilla anguilla TaxID=7936 RepID=A0A0E9P934_ANGAN